MSLINSMGGEVFLFLVKIGEGRQIWAEQPGCSASVSFRPESPEF